MRPDFHSINFRNLKISPEYKSASDPRETPENIVIKSSYSLKDLENMEHLNYAAGLPPFLQRALFQPCM